MLVVHYFPLFHFLVCITVYMSTLQGLKVIFSAFSVNL